MGIRKRLHVSFKGGSGREEPGWRSQVGIIKDATAAADGLDVSEYRCGFCQHWLQHDVHKDHMVNPTAKP